MTGLYIVKDDQPTRAISPEDLDRVQRALERLVILVNDPIKLMDRARALLTGTAERVDGLDWHA